MESTNVLSFDMISKVFHTTPLPSEPKNQIGGMILDDSPQGKVRSKRFKIEIESERIKIKEEVVLKKHVKTNVWEIQAT